LPQITLPLYIKLPQLIALSRVCLILLCTDTGLKPSTAQFRSHTQFTLFNFSVKTCSISTIHCYYSFISHTPTHRDITVLHLTVHSAYMFHIHHLKPTFLFQLFLDIPILYLPVALISDAMLDSTILGSVALWYSSFVYSILCLDVACSHHVYFQQLGK
jgi:hypothetical protein